MPWPRAASSTITSSIQAADAGRDAEHAERERRRRSCRRRRAADELRDGVAGDAIASHCAARRRRVRLRQLRHEARERVDELGA